MPADFEAIHAVAGPFCCSETQVVLLVDYLLYILTCLLLWHSRVLLPLKLLAVFLHELGHALAAWLVCGSVHAIEVHANQGGVTMWSVKSQARMKMAQHVVLPAGYLGSAAWGGAIIVACARPETTHVMAFVLMFFLLLALGYSLCGRKGDSDKRDCTLPALSSGLLILLAGLLYICYYTKWPYRDLLLSKVLLVIGTMNTLFATYDIWEDCISRTVERSDAYKYAQLLGCATPKCIGILWFLLSLIMAIGMLGLALLWTPEAQSVSGISEFSNFSWLCMLIPTALLVVAIVFRLCCSRTYGGQVTRVTRGIQLESPNPSTPAFKIDGAALVTEERNALRDTTSDEEGEVYMTTGTHAVGTAATAISAETSDDESSDHSDSIIC